MRSPSSPPRRDPSEIATSLPPLRSSTPPPQARLARSSRDANTSVRRRENRCPTYQCGRRSCRRELSPECRLASGRIVRPSDDVPHAQKLVVNRTRLVVRAPETRPHIAPPGSTTGGAAGGRTPARRRPDRRPLLHGLRDDNATRIRADRSGRATWRDTLNSGICCTPLPGRHPFLGDPTFLELERDTTLPSQYRPLVA